MEQIRQLRQERNLSQAQLAVMAGMDPATLNRLEQGKGNPTIRTLQQVADVLGVSAADLLEESYPKAQAPLPLENGPAGLSDALQKDLAVLFRGLARRGQQIVEQSVSEGASKELAAELAEYHDEAAALYRIMGKRDVFGHQSEELVEAEGAYQEVESRIQDLLKQDISGEQRDRRFAPRRAEDSYTEERGADVS